MCKFNEMVSSVEIQLLFFFRMMTYLSPYFEHASKFQTQRIQWFCGAAMQQEKLKQI